MSEEQKNKGLIAAPDEFYVKKAINRLGDHRRYVISRWRLLTIAVIIGGAIGLIASLLTQTVYTAECTFVLEEDGKGSGGLSQYSALASMAGLDVGGSAGLFQSDNIIQLYKSRLMVKQTLLTPVNFNGRPQLLIDRYLQLNKLREKWAGNNALAYISFNTSKNKFTILQDSVMTLVVNDINKNYLSVDKPDKKMSLVSVKVKTSDQLFAQNFTNVIVANVNTFYIQEKTKKALLNVKLLQHQADSVHRLVSTNIGSAASAYDANPNPDPANAQQLRAPAQRRQVDVQAATAIFTEVVRNLEIARASLQRETPLIDVIDEPVLPLPKDSLGRMKGVFTGAAVALLLAVLWLVALKIYRGIMA
jgi:hypothetical protein